MYGIIKLNFERKKNSFIFFVQLIDTGGITSIDKPKTSIDRRNPQKKINELVRSQSIIALEQANSIIFITDVSDGTKEINC